VVDVNNSECFVPWTGNEATQSSTWREVKAVQYMCTSHKTLLSNSVVKWYSDNQNVEKVIARGSMKQVLQELAVQIFQFCAENNIQIDFVWIPRTENTKADAISKFVDFDDWGVSERISNFCQRRWGNCSLDAFANGQNSKNVRFYSKFWCPNTLGVDAFAFSWVGEHVWLVPPLHLIGKVIAKVKQDKCTGILVFPKWVSAAFWPLIHTGSTYIPIVKDFLEYANPRNFFIPGTCKKSVFANETFKGAVVVVRLAP